LGGRAGGAARSGSLRGPGRRGVVAPPGLEPAPSRLRLRPCTSGAAELRSRVGQSSLQVARRPTAPPPELLQWPPERGGWSCVTLSRRPVARRRLPEAPQVGGKGRLRW